MIIGTLIIYVFSDVIDKVIVYMNSILFIFKKGVTLTSSVTATEEGEKELAITTISKTSVQSKVNNKQQE